MKSALEYCTDDLKGSLDLSDIKEVLKCWDEFQKKLKEKFEEALGELESETLEDSDEDEE